MLKALRVIGGFFILNPASVKTPSAVETPSAVADPDGGLKRSYIPFRYGKETPVRVFNR
jgi:hypothetical protein